MFIYCCLRAAERVQIFTQFLRRRGIKNRRPEKHNDCYTISKFSGCQVLTKIKAMILFTVAVESCSFLWLFKNCLYISSDTSYMFWTINHRLKLKHIVSWIYEGIRYFRNPTWLRKSGLSHLLLGTLSFFYKKVVSETEAELS